VQDTKKTRQPIWRMAWRHVVHTVHDQLAGLLSRETLANRAATYGGGHRSRIYPPLTTLGLFIEQALGFDATCQAATGWALGARTAQGLSPNSMNTGPYCKARQRLPLALVDQLNQDVATAAETAVDPPGREGRTLLIDGTTVSMSDTPELQQAFPQNRQQKPGVGFPQARIVGMISLSSACVLHWRVSACKGPHTHESQQLWALLEHVRPGDTVVADRAYASYFLLAALTQRGASFVIRQHQRRRSNLAKARRLGAADHQVSWAKPQRPPWMGYSTYHQLPDTLTVREVSDQRLTVTTNETDPETRSARQIIRQYRQRWHIELDFRAIKCVMDMTVLRCQSPAMAIKEIAVHLLAYNLVRATMAHATGAQSSVREFSFSGARRAVTDFQAQRRHNPHASFHRALRQLYQRVIVDVLPSRPDRVEPRANKRRPKQQRYLNQPRYLARQALRAAA
jgi:hypothetical protein